MVILLVDVMESDVHSQDRIKEQSQPGLGIISELPKAASSLPDRVTSASFGKSFGAPNKSSHDFYHDLGRI
jgi:hypothetical protein